MKTITLFIALAFGVAGLAPAAPGLIEPKTPVKHGFKHKVKHGLRSTRHGLHKMASASGHGAKKLGHATVKGSKKLVKVTGHGLKKGVHGLSKVTAKGADKLAHKTQSK